MRRLSGRNRRGRGALPRPAQAGFTLLELMVALIVTALVITFLVRSMLGVQQSWDGSKDRVGTSQNTRAALDTMVRDLRMAGSGYGGRPVTTGGIPGNLVFPCQPAPGVTESDTLHILGSLDGVETITSTAMASPSDGLFVVDTTGFEVGSLIVITNGVDANMFEITGILGATGNFIHSSISSFNDPLGHVRWPSGGYSAGATVAQVQQVSYWITETATGRRLMRALGDDTPVPVAFDVEELRIRYVLADGSESPDPVDPTLIRSVFLDYTPVPTDAAAPATAVTIRIQPRVLG